MPAIPYNDTPVIDRPWDGPAAEKALKNDDGADVYRKEYAWVDPDKDADTKVAYKLPHHEVSADGTPGAANVNGVRNALSRLPDSDVPDADQSAVKAHLQKHLDKFNSTQPKSQAGERGASVLWASAILGKRLALKSELVAMFQAALAAGDQPPFFGQNDDDGEMDLPSPGVIPLHGLITPHGSFLSFLFGGGGGGLHQFRARLDAAVNDPSVSHIVLDVDSPGGLADLVAETAAEVRAARDVKPVTAVANTMACSAAYWIASQASELVVTPSGECGSVGVYQMHTDVSGAQEQRGIKTTLISAGKYKTDGHPYEPLSDTAREAMDQDVNDIYDMFITDVAQGRDVRESTVRGGYGEGRSLLAQRALKAGMVDRVATLDDVVAELTNTTGSNGNTSPSLRAKAAFELL